MNLEKMLPLLQCPRSGTSLVRIDAETLRSEAGATYPIVDGKPILVRRVEPLHVIPPRREVISKNASAFSAPAFLPDEAVVVHLGCGDVPSADGRVISIDILPTSAADLVAEAEHLPIKTGSVDHLVSGAVFEHVYDPRASATEVRRVLKDGGTFYIDTAFMQGYHGFPSHFFNMTPQAVETFIVDDFILDASGVPDSATCAHLFLEVQHRMLDSMTPAAAKELLDKPLREVVEIFAKDETKANPYFANFSEYAHRALAASFVVQGRKPAGYDQRAQAEREAFAHVRRAYYAARVGVITHHGEVVIYSSRCAAMGRAMEGVATPDLHDLLRTNAVTDTSSEASYLDATKRLDTVRQSLIELREKWLRLYCS